MIIRVVLWFERIDSAKAQGLAEDLNCTVIAPDTFRGTLTDFTSKAMWLALTTPQDRVNDDLDAICDFVESGKLNLQATTGSLAHISLRDGILLWRRKSDSIHHRTENGCCNYNLL